MTRFRSSKFGILRLTVFVFSLTSLESSAQLDDTWTVTVGGQHVRVNPDGSFRISNISAADDFGANGPGSPRDFLSDQFLRLTGTGIINGVPHWARSEFFQFTQDQIYMVNDVIISPTPPQMVNSLTIDIPDPILEIDQLTQATTTAEFGDGSIGNVTLRTAWTVYRTSNPEIVSINENGLITAHKPGEVAITATNEGVTAVKMVTVFTDTIMTTIEGFVVLEDGTSAVGVEVMPRFGGGMAITDVEGFFSIPAVVPANTMNLSVEVEGELGGQQLVGRADRLTPEADGVTDAGVIVLRLPPCDGQWEQGTFCPPGIRGSSSGEPGIGEIFAFTKWDDGTGEALYAAGKFNIAHCTHVKNIAKWDGSTWFPVGVGLGGDGSSADTTVRALAAFDDGTGPALYAAGNFANAGATIVNNIAKWNGSTWSPLGSGTFGLSPDIYAMTVFDDGTGPALYVGGSFTTIGGVSRNRIARWHPSTGWTSLSTGMGGSGTRVSALTVFDDGTGLALYAGGTFTTAGGLTVNRVAKWNGSTWSPLANGVNGNVNALTVFDDGTGPALYAGGFLIFDGISGGWGFAKWDGSDWTPLVQLSTVTSLAVFEDDMGSALYVGGTFAFGNSGVITASRILRWAPDTGVTELGTGMNGTVNALTTFDEGAGPRLFLGGRFMWGNDITLHAIARWDGSTMTPVPQGNGLGEGVLALTVFDDGNGLALYAAGHLLTAGNIRANRVARWNGAEWSPLGTGLNEAGIFGGSAVLALEVYDDGTGPALYAGGIITTAGGVPTTGVAKWDGSNWSALASGLGSSTVQVLEVFDNGAGPELYAGGTFGGPPFNNIAKWNGSTWSALGSGMNGRVFSMKIYDDGRGPALYVGGEFTLVNGVAASGIARLCGSTWEPLGTGLSAGVNRKVSSLEVFDDGTGPALYVAGQMTAAGGQNALNIAKWDGKNWFSLGSGINRPVYALTAFDDGTGPALYAAGNFYLAGGLSALQIAKWDGFAWSPLGQGIEYKLGGFIDAFGSGVAALQVFDDGSGPALFAGSSSMIAGGLPSAYIAKWQRPPHPCPAP